MAKEEDIDKNIGDFVEYLLRNDETAAVLKCHLELERHLDKLIEKYFTQNKIILKWSFSDKVEILFSLGIINEFANESLL
jgi:hypothetical protein